MAQSVNLKTRKNKRVANSRIKRAAKRTSIDRKMVAGFLSLNNATSTTNKWSKVKERGLYYKREVLSHIPKCHSVSNWKQKASFGALQIIQISRTVVIAIRCGQYGSQSKEFLCMMILKGFD